ncbi:single-stranded DNA-binding protein [Streptomyces sp. NPDC096013]|uniref:single-stranded DNA-binding protein n=1 Tax=Streptomyces sp. NPDC096013 TaxID=3366069 RepID=UPI00382C92F1
MSPSVARVSGTVTGDVEVRFSETGVAVCRFRLTETPAQWDAAARRWRDGTPIRYVCTAWRDLARNTAESLVNGVRVLVDGRITEIRNDSVYLSADDIGVSLRRRIAYTEASLPNPAAASPVTPPPAPQSATAPRTATGRPGHPPAWWQQESTSGWSSSGSPPTAADGLPASR